MAAGNSAIFSGVASQDTALDWETDFSASPAVPTKARFNIKEGYTPQVVAQKLADAFNSKNGPGYRATPTGAKVE